jgi:hypothetical protein
MLETIEVKSKGAKPDIPPSLLWEYDLQTFNFDKSYRLVCERILQLGNLHDWKEMMAYYSLEEIKDAIEWSAQMDERDKVFCRFFLQSDLLTNAA